jgi:hypothetical protein
MNALGHKIVMVLVACVFSATGWLVARWIFAPQPKPPAADPMQQERIEEHR